MTVSNHQKIMAVDDEFDILQIIKRYLEKWGFAVDAFMNPLDAIEQFKKDPDLYSVILLDVRMPEISGIALAELMLKVKPGARIVIMTAYELRTEDLKFSLPTISYNDILQKPFRLVQICNAVKKQLQRTTQ
jgi:two-component system, cell cycle sensor histidine kinase and response regulator CckA